VQACKADLQGTITRVGLLLTAAVHLLEHWVVVPDNQIDFAV